MKKIALVSITLNAVNPMTKYLSTQKDVQILNYLDSYIMEKVRINGKVTDDCMRRMLNMISSACEDGADGIIITCTMFSKYVEEFSRLFSVPIIGADVAMMDLVGSKGGKTAMLCTFSKTVEPSTNLLKSYFEKYNKEYEITTYVLVDAYKEAENQNIELHNKIIKNKIEELDKEYDNIVLAQISMADAAIDAETKNAKLYTSPFAAYNKLTSIIE